MCLGLLLFLINGNSTHVPVTMILNPRNGNDLNILNLIVLSIILIGISNIWILLASKYANLRSDRSAAQIFKSIEQEHFEFTQLSQQEKDEQLEHAIKKRRSPELIMYLMFFSNEERTKRNKRAKERSLSSPPKKQSTINPLDPLVWAVENDNWDLFNLLMERSDMDVNKEDTEGKTAVTAAILNDKIEMLKIIMKRTNFNSNLSGRLGSPLGIALSHRNK